MSAAALLTDPQRGKELHAALKGLPRAASITDRTAMLRSFWETFGKYIGNFSLLLGLFASIRWQLPVILRNASVSKRN